MASIEAFREVKPNHENVDQVLAYLNIIVDSKKQATASLNGYFKYNSLSSYNDDNEWNFLTSLRRKIYIVNSKNLSVISRNKVEYQVYVVIII